MTGYYSIMLDLILWQPNTSGLYKPVNISEVHAHGVELGLNLACAICKFRFILNNGYNYCRSTNEKATSIGDNSVGKQLIYTPENTLNSTLRINRNGFYGSYTFPISDYDIQLQTTPHPCPVIIFLILFWGKTFI